jgi:tetratricopeptide (TPR) repeat protein
MKILIVFTILYLSYEVFSASISVDKSDGQAAFKRGLQYLKLGQYEEAADDFWIAIMHSGNLKPPYDLKSAFENFLFSYRKRNMVEYGLVRVGRQYISQGLVSDANLYIKQALEINPELVEAHLLLAKISGDDSNARLKHLIEALRIDPNGYEVLYINSNEYILTKFI